MQVGRRSVYGSRAMSRPGLRSVLLHRWDILPEYLRRMHWNELTFDDKWDMTFRSSHPDVESRFADLTTTKSGDLDLAYRSLRLQHPYESDPIMALEHVFEDRSSVPDVLDVMIYPRAKVHMVSSVCENGI